MLFAIPLMTVVLTGTGSIVLFLTYITFVDFMNNLGHCNFELIPAELFSIFPPLKYIMYTPTYVSLSLSVWLNIISIPPNHKIPSPVVIVDIGGNGNSS